VVARQDRIIGWIGDNIAVVNSVEYPTEEMSPSLVAILSAVDIADYPFREQTSPDGSVTVVFTDIEESTEMLERLGEERWLEVMREHNRLVRDRVSARDGVVVKSQGDGFMIIFTSATAALACSVELQQIFSTYNTQRADQQLRVRIGLHTGNVFQEHDDFLGKDVIMAARITGRARGGEVLVSEDLKRYTERVGRWRFGPPLEVRLKGLASSQRVHSVYWNSELQ
jgi:eukaryotic-like serine/threonine-protein kinase